MSEYDSMLLYKCRWIAPITTSFAWTEPSQPSMFVSRYRSEELKKMWDTKLGSWSMPSWMWVVDPKFCSAWIDEQNQHKLKTLRAYRFKTPRHQFYRSNTGGLWIWKTPRIDVFSTKRQEVLRILDKQPSFSSERNALRFLRRAY